MRAVSILYRRELGAYFRSHIGYIVAALLLLVDGVLFQWALTGKKLSAEALRLFFLYSGGLVQVAGIVLSARLIAEERNTQTIVLLHTSPIRNFEIVIGKYLAALTFLTIIIALTMYMPLLILINGKIADGQLVVGYLGLFSLGACSLAIGTFASALAKSQLVALAIGGTINGLLTLLYPLSEKLDPPLKTVLSQLDMWWIRFQQGPMVGILHLKDVVFYGAIVYFFLYLAIKTMEAKRWQ